MAARCTTCGDREMDIDGSFLITVDRTAWGDISLSLTRHDLRIQLDPAEAARICAEIWTALGHPETSADQAAA